MRNLLFLRRAALAACVLPVVAACGGDAIDEDGARALWESIHDDAYRDWAPAPGYETPQPTIRAHGATASVYLNDTLEDALATTGLTEWPDGAVVVKDSFDGGEPALIAAMEKQGGAWFYAEWTPDGEVKYAGRPDVCTNCHAAGNDELLVVALP